MSFMHHPIVEPDLNNYNCLVASQAPHLSDRYRHVPTIDVVKEIRNHGFKVTEVRGSKPKSNAGSHGFHTVRFRQEFGVREVGGCYPELLLGNSHDGSSQCRLSVALFRVACSNGLVTGTHGDFVYGLTHIGKVGEEILKIVNDVGAKVPVLEEKIARWSEKNISEASQLEFAVRAAALRFGSSSPEGLAPQLLDPRRFEDAGSSVWKVYNRIQENLTYGGAAYSRPTKKGGVRKMRSRVLNAPSRVLKVNQGLWDLAEEFAS